MVSHSTDEHRKLPATAAGSFTMAEDLTVTRVGYGAMQLAGPNVFGERYETPRVAGPERSPLYSCARLYWTI